MSAAFLAASPASAAAAAASASRGRRTSRRINRSGAAVKGAQGGTATTTSRRAAAAPAAAAAATTTAASASAGCRVSRVTTRTRRGADAACAATDTDIPFLLDAEGSVEPASQADFDKLWQWLATNGVDTGAVAPSFMGAGRGWGLVAKKDLGGRAPHSTLHTSLASWHPLFNLSRLYPL